ncbi:MAG: hypothetical protein ABIH82_00530 [Candidatus Woesearchaeota archaeon]
MTLETLYDILRNEKKREDLQKLEDSFFVDVVSYLREKQSLLDSKTTEDELFAAGEKEKLEYELRSIKRILKQIYEMREKKIIEISLNRSRTGSDIIDTSSMLRVEKDFYLQTLSTLDRYRRGILLQLFKGDLPDIAEAVSPRRPTVVSPSNSSVSSSSPSNTSVSSTTTQKPTLNQNKETSLKSTSAISTNSSTNSKSAISTNSKLNYSKLNDPSLIKVKFIHPVPSFIWKDMKEYGPFSSGDETEIFPEVANLLVRKGRAEKV